MSFEIINYSGSYIMDKYEIDRLFDAITNGFEEDLDIDFHSRVYNKLSDLNYSYLEDLFDCPSFWETTNVPDVSGIFNDLRNFNLHFFGIQEILKICLDCLRVVIILINHFLGLLEV